MKIAIGNDHAGTQYKKAIVSYLEKEGLELINFGTDSETSVDYPDFVHPVAKALEATDVDFGIIICGSGNGVSMTANKHKHIRAALCWTTEITSLARSHNNANVLSIPARYISLAQAIEMVKVFLETKFEGGRHERRVEKISKKTANAEIK